MSTSIWAEPRKRPLDRLLVDEAPRVDRERASLRHQADDDRGPPGPDRFPGSLDRVLEADRLEGVVGATVGQVADGCRRVDARNGLDGLGGAELPSELELLRARIHGHDRRGSGQARALDDVQPDAAAAPDGHARLRLDLGGANDRSVARDDRTAAESRHLEVDVAADPDRGRYGDNGVLGEGRDRVEVVQLRPVQGDAARPVGERSGLGHLSCEPAKVSPSFPAGSADAARRHEREHDVIAALRGARRRDRPRPRLRPPRGRGRAAGARAGRRRPRADPTRRHRTLRSERGSPAPSAGRDRSRGSRPAHRPARALPPSSSQRRAYKPGRHTIARCEPPSSGPSTSLSRSRTSTSHRRARAR